MILSLDASTQRGSVALIRDRQVVQELFAETPRGRGGALFSCLAEILREGTEIRRVIVGVGPGSYNGIRSAIAAAWGIAMTRDIPLVGVSSILGLDDASYVAVGDARRGQYFFARVHHGAFLIGPGLLTKDQLAAALQKSPGLPVFASAPVEFLPGIVIRTPSAARLGMLAAHWAPNYPQPLYLKAAHITTSRKAKERP